MLTQVPPGPQVWHWLASHVLLQTPVTQVWQGATLQSLQVPLTQV